MPIELYWGSGSPPAWRVMLGLAFKGLPYTSHLLSFQNRETRTPAFLLLNPRGKVPVLKDGDYVVNESLAILSYLDTKYPEPPLFGRNAEETGQVWRFVMEYETIAAAVFSAVTRPILFGSLATDLPKVLEGLPALHAELEQLERRVASGALVGSELSAADLVWFCAMQTLMRAATRPAAASIDLAVSPLAERWPGILRWARRIEAIPGFDATVPPHWRTSDPPSTGRLA